MAIFQGCTCCPHSMAGCFCWGFGLALYPQSSRLCCSPVVVNFALQAGDRKRCLYTLFPSCPQQCRNSSQHFSRCSHLPPAPTESTMHSSFRSPLQHNPACDLGCSRVDRLAHLAVIRLLGLESSFALPLKKWQFSLQEKQERHVKYRCRGRET